MCSAASYLYFKIRFHTTVRGLSVCLEDLEMAQRLTPFKDYALQGPFAAIAGQLMGAAEVCFFYDHLYSSKFFLL